MKLSSILRLCLAYTKTRIHRPGEIQGVDLVALKRAVRQFICLLMDTIFVNCDFAYVVLHAGSPLCHKARLHNVNC